MSANECDGLSVARSLMCAGANRVAYSVALEAAEAGAGAVKQQCVPGV